MTLKKGYKALLAEAEATVRTLSVAEAQALHGRADVQFVDLRDPRELQREGKIPGAFHAPRGMLEFWIDPESPYYKDVFAPGKTFVFYCQSGWRSALATRAAQEMGLPDVCHVGGGYRAWQEAGGPTEPYPPAATPPRT
jgi:rhodanese-related sulfurtransferase